MVVIQKIAEEEGKVVKYVNRQSVPVKVIEKQILSETILQPNESIEVKVEADEIVAEDAPIPFRSKLRQRHI